MLSGLRKDTSAHMAQGIARPAFFAIVAGLCRQGLSVCPVLPAVLHILPAGEPDDRAESPF